MKRRGLVILSLFLILVLVPSISTDQTEERPKFVFVPTNDFYRTVHTNPERVLEESNPQEVNSFLGKNGFEDGKQDPDFLRLLGGNSAEDIVALENLVYGFMVDQQVSELRRITGTDPEVHIVFQQINAEEIIKKELLVEMSGEEEPSLLLQMIRETTPYFEIGLSPQELQSAINSEAYRDYRRVEKLENAGEFLSEEETSELESLRRKVYSVSETENLAKAVIAVNQGRLALLPESRLPNSIGGNAMDRFIEEEGKKRIREVIANRGIKIDPKKDRIVELSGDANGAERGHVTRGTGWIVLLNGRSDLHNLPYVLAHESSHLDFLYCDQYNYKSWNSVNSLLEVLGKGCPNPYDPLGCCADNPRFKDQNGHPDRKAYDAHLTSIGLGHSCLPEGSIDNPSCWTDLEGELNLAMAGTDEYLCFGNPCEPGDPHPPYCRDLMGPAVSRYVSEACFEGNLVKENLPPARGLETPEMSSPSQR